MPTYDYSKAIEIAPDVYWLGFYDPVANFHCHPYLIKVGDEGILIDPGSLPHFPIVAKKATSVIKPRKIKYIIAHHQDPDLAANIPVFEKIIHSKDLRVITTERASFLTSYYGFEAPYRFVEEGPLQFNGRTFQFITTPYLHAPGAFVTYDPANKVLFSSDVFGSFYENWSLYAGDAYPKAMERFHSTYMPPGDVLKNQMGVFEKLQLDLIAPQHGSLIEKTAIGPNIDALKKIRTGQYLKKRLYAGSVVRNDIK
ncbi:MBL fold metallo-hydrolase [Candidatus Uhrbacteria bacterium]|nr:MBL fold metallo-hydrolase [Candidatus Uhrbacteria bacterium]